MRTTNRSTYLRIISILVAVFSFTFLSMLSYAADEFAWAPQQKGAPYTATLKDSAGNQVMGEFNSVVKWKNKDGKADIEDWDSNAKFRFRGDDGEWHYVKNGEVKKGITSLNPNYTGTLSGNIKDYPAEAHPGEKKRLF